MIMRSQRTPIDFEFNDLQSLSTIQFTSVDNQPTLKGIYLLI